METGKTERGTCSLLLTNQVESSVNSSFTVLQTDDIIEETESGRARFCISAGESRIIWLRLKDGTAAIRRGRLMPVLTESDLRQHLSSGDLPVFM